MFNLILKQISGPSLFVLNENSEYIRLKMRKTNNLNKFFALPQKSKFQLTVLFVTEAFYNILYVAYNVFLNNIIKSANQLYNTKETHFLYQQ